MLPMLLQTLLDESHITIAYDHRNEWLYADWRGDQNLTTVQHGCLEMLRLLREYKCDKVLNDNTKVTNMWSEAAEWGGKEFFPAIAEAGLQYFAWVYSTNLYSRLSTDLTLQFTTGKSVVGTFDDIDAAKAWLTQMVPQAKVPSESAS